jgi:hypothetical protein
MEIIQLRGDIAKCAFDSGAAVGAGAGGDAPAAAADEELRASAEQIHRM